MEQRGEQAEGADARANTPPPPAPLAAEAAEAQSSAKASSFRKFRELLMAARFTSQDNLPMEVLPQLFIGSFGAANNREAVVANGITHVLCVSSSLPLPFPDQCEYLRLDVADQAHVPIAASFPAAFAFIDSAIAGRGVVLVHCYLGRSRSATIVLAYLMARRQMRLADALAFLKQIRPQIEPNSGFHRQLQAYEQQLTQHQST